MRSIHPHHHHPPAINKPKAIVIPSTSRLRILRNRREVEQTLRIFNSRLHLSFRLATDSSADSSSDEHLQGQQSTANAVTLQRKVSDRKAKRVRAKQNEATGSASSSELLRKSTIDELLRSTLWDRSVFQRDRMMKLWPKIRNTSSSSSNSNNSNNSNSSSNNKRRRNVGRVSNDERKWSTIKHKTIQESILAWVRTIFPAFLDPLSTLQIRKRRVKTTELRQTSSHRMKMIPALVITRKIAK